MRFSVNVNHDGEVRMYSPVNTLAASLANNYELEKRLQKFMQRFDQPITVHCFMQENLDLKIVGIHDARAKTQLQGDELDYVISLLNTLVAGPTLEKLA